MKVAKVNNNSETNFGYKMPTKKTYRAMKGYYSLKNDKASMVTYEVLHNEAKARLHYIKFLKAQNEFSDISGKFPEGKSLNVRFKHILKTAKAMTKVVYEKLASVYYYSI